MPLESKLLKRVFIYSHRGTKKELSDPDPSMSPERVLNLYAAQYSPLTNATIQGPDTKGGKIIFTFATTLGTKG